MHALRRRAAALLAIAVLALTFSTVDPVAAIATPRIARAETSTTTTSTSTTTTSTTSTTVAPSAYANRHVEKFGTTGWWRRMGLGWAPGRTRQVFAADGSYLRVSFAKGTHNGATWRFKTGTSDAVHLSYRLRLSPNWDSSKSASNIKLPGFGQPGWNALGACLVACGGAAADGITGWSARGDLFQRGVSGWYVYSLANTWGTGYRWAQPAYQVGRWYTVDLYVRMNDVGAANGSLTAYVDGRKVYERGDFVFRLVDTLHVGNAWFDFYYGGSGLAPADMWIDIDNVVIEH